MILLRALSRKDEALVRAMSTRVVSLSHEVEDGGMDTLSITVDNDDLGLFREAEIFEAEGFIAQWGEPGNVTLPRKFRVKGIKGFLTMVVEATGELMRADLRPVNRLWEEEEVTDIVRKISGEMGYPNPDIQAPEEMVVLTRQQFEPNARFLQRLAHEFGYAFWVDSRVHWRSRDARGVPRRQIVFRGTTDPGVPGYVIGEPTVNFAFTRTKPAQVEAVAPMNKAEAKPGSAPEPDVKVVPSPRTGSPRIVAGQYGGLRQTALSAQKAAVTPEARQVPAEHTETVYAPSGRPQKASGMWRGKQDTASIEMTIRGIGDLVVGDMLEIANFGAVNDGKWYVRKLVSKDGKDGFTQELVMTRSTSKKGTKPVEGQVNQTAATNEVGTAGAPDPRPTETKIIGTRYGGLVERAGAPRQATRKEPGYMSELARRMAENKK